MAEVGATEAMHSVARRAQPVKSTDAVLELRGIHKRFGGVHALRGADLVVSRPGTVMGLLGENGSGKSTLLNVLSGQISLDAGSVLVDGRPLRLAGPKSAVAAGISLVSQETAVAADLSVTENILLGRLPRGVAGVDWKGARRRATAVLHRLRLDYDPSAMVGTLRPDQRQMVEIARALSMDARVVVLDEPTSSLTEEEAANLFAVVRQLSADGVSTILVSHRLAEMFAIADEMTILRDGSTVSSGPIAAYDTDRVIVDMTGRDPRARVPQVRSGVDIGVGPRLKCSRLVSGDTLRGVDLEVRPGEIVGIAGLVGAGRSELLEVLFGMRPRDEGEISVDCEEYRPRSPGDAITRGMGFLPPERKTQGLVLSMAIGDNLTMVESASRHRWARPRPQGLQAAVADARARLHLRAEDPEAPVSTLSGGNQQKVALGKWLRMRPQIFLLDEPTRGVDVGAKREIHRLLRAAAADGCSLLVSSSENDELLSLCDRILVMFQGRITSVVLAEAVSETRLAQLAGGHE